MKKIILGTIAFLIIVFIGFSFYFGKTGISIIDTQSCSAIIQANYGVGPVMAKNNGKVNMFMIGEIYDELNQKYVGEGKICSAKEFDEYTKKINDDWNKAFGL